MKKSLMFLLMLVLTMLFVVGCDDSKTEEPAAESVTITLSGPTEVEVGSEISLTATVTGIEQYVLDWKSSDATVATVDSEGTVLGVKAGTVTIEASIAEVKGTYSVTVKEKPVNPNERVVFFNHDWEESDWDGEQAFADGEGNNFMIQGGKAHTINNSGKIGPCSSWSFAYTPYDMNIGECVVEAKVKYVGSSVENEGAAFSIRHLYALFYDLQIFFENGDTYSGIRLYNSVSSYVGDSRDVNMGGQATDTRFVAGQDYVIKLAYEYVTDTTANVYVFVNDTLELFLEELPMQDVNAKFGIGASVYSHIEVDYFKCYSPLDSDYATPINPDDYQDLAKTLVKTTAVKGWEEVYVYATKADGTSLTGEFPGAKMTADEEGVYSYEIKGALDKLVFTNGTEKTAELTVEDAKRNIFIFSEKNADGNYEGEWVSVLPEPEKEVNPSVLVTSQFEGNKLVKAWEFNGEAGKTGVEVLGDSYSEGAGFLTDGEGYLRTVREGTTLGTTTSWCFSRAPYDLGIPADSVLELKFVPLTTGVVALRAAHASYADFQVNVSENAGEAGLYVYKDGSAWFSQDGLTIKPNEEHILSVKFTKTGEAAEGAEGAAMWGVYTIEVYIDNVLVTTVENTVSMGPSASIGVLVSDNINAAIDYLRIIDFTQLDVVSQFEGENVFRTWEFNEEAGKTGAEVLGDAYVEGTGFLTDGKGYLCTVSEGTTLGVSPSWSSSRAPYDLGIPADHVLEMKFIILNEGIAVIRTSHEIYCDIQVAASNTEGNGGVYAYKSGSEWGGQGGLTVTPGQAHILSVQYVKVANATEGAEGADVWGVYNVYFYLDNELVLTLENTQSAGPAASIGLLAAQGSNVKFDYLRIYDMTELKSQYEEETLFRGWEFDEEAGKTGAEVLGEGYVEGTGFLTDGEGYLCSVKEGTTLGESPAWSSSRAPYDLGIPADHVLEMKVIILNEGVAVLRTSHAIYCDIQLVASNTEGNGGVYAYKSGSEWGGQGGLTVKPGEEYILSVRYEKVAEAAEGAEGADVWGVYNVYFYVNNELVLTLENTQSAGPAASIGLLVAQGSNVKFDYLRIYDLTNNE